MWRIFIYCFAYFIRGIYGKSLCDWLCPLGGEQWTCIGICFDIAVYKRNITKLSETNKLLNDNINLLRIQTKYFGYEQTSGLYLGYVDNNRIKDGNMTHTPQINYCQGNLSDSIEQVYQYKKQLFICENVGYGCIRTNENIISELSILQDKITKMKGIYPSIVSSVCIISVVILYQLSYTLALYL